MGQLILAEELDATVPSAPQDRPASDGSSACGDLQNTAGVGFGSF